MRRDINRLFSMINQADLPYQVFEDDKWEAAQIAEPVVASEAPSFPSPDLPANEDAPLAHAGLFRAYNNVEAALVAPHGTPLADVFGRMNKRQAV